MERRSCGAGYASPVPRVDGLRMLESDSDARRRERDTWTAELLDLEAGRIGLPGPRPRRRSGRCSPRRRGSRSSARRPTRPGPSHGVLVDLQALGYDVRARQPDRRRGRRAALLPDPAPRPSRRRGRWTSSTCSGCRRRAPRTPARRSRSARGACGSSSGSRAARPARSPTRRAWRGDEPVPRRRGGRRVIERPSAPTSRRVARADRGARGDVGPPSRPTSRDRRDRRGSARRSTIPAARRAELVARHGLGIDGRAGAAGPPGRATACRARRSRATASRRSGSRRDGRPRARRQPRVPGDRPRDDDPRRGLRRAPRPAARPDARDARAAATRIRAPTAGRRSPSRQRPTALRSSTCAATTATSADLYPWPFRPAALGVDGDAPGRDRLAESRASCRPAPPDGGRRRALLDAGARAHAPYSGAPSAAVLRAARTGDLLSAGCVESVAFNPSISALQAALVELAAARRRPGRRSARRWLGVHRRRRRSIPSPASARCSRAVAPGARSTSSHWRTAPT